MKYKIITLTPVHISTGEQNASFLYNMGDNYHLNCYSIDNLIRCIPPKELLEMYKFDKKKIIELFRRYVKYDELKPKYSVYCYDQFPFKENVSVQMKSLGKPYIPGSTIKGAIMNAIVYGILSEKKQEVIQILKQNQLNFKNFDKSLFEKLFDKEFNEIFSLFSSCILCADIFYEDMILCNGIRLNMNNNGKGKNQNFVRYECIDAHQICVSTLIKIDKNKKNILKKRITSLQKYEILIKYLNEVNIAVVCRNFYRVLLKDDKEYFVEDRFGYFDKSDFEGRSDIVNFIDNMSFENKNVFYLRLGNSTNYFYKTVSIFIKNNFSSYYKEKFEDVFSPIGRNKKAKYDKMPKTRTVFTFDDECFLPGFIKVEFYNNN